MTTKVIPQYIGRMGEVITLPGGRMGEVITLPGVLEVRPVQSGSDPAHFYQMIRTILGWYHAEGDCKGDVIRGHCGHRRDLNMESTALIATSSAALAIIDQLEDEELEEAIRGELTETWAYSFPMGGKTVTGVSSKGVENGCREMAKKGEVIRALDVKIEQEDSQEARFVAQAGRFAVDSSGEAHLLDTAIRGKRQSKWTTRTDGTIEPNKDWYEHGITKATRNAKLALMPDSVVAMIIAEAKAAGRLKQAPGATQGRVAAPQSRGRSLPQGGGNNATTGGADAMTQFWQDARGLGLSNDTVLARSQAMFGNREPIKLTPQERIDLLAKLTQEKQAAISPEHACEMKFDDAGRSICGICGQPADEETGKHAVVQAGLGVSG